MQEDEEVGGEGGWDDLVQARYRRMMVLAVSLPLLQQASGINSITFYSSSVRYHTCGGRAPPLDSTCYLAVCIAASASSHRVATEATLHCTVCMKPS